MMYVRIAFCLKSGQLEGLKFFAMKRSLCLLAALLTIVYAMSQEKVGINTDAPASSLHVFSSGQVLTPGGLLLLGNTSEANLTMDFNYLQSYYSNSSPLSFFLQPLGGDVMINGNPTLSPLVGPQARLHVHSPGQVLTDNGLLLLGDSSEAHLTMDFNYIQSSYGSSGLELDIQPAGGDLRMVDGGLFVRASDKFVGVRSVNPQQELWINGELAFSVPPLAPDQIDKIALNGNALEKTSMVGFGYLTDTGISGLRAIGNQELYAKSDGAHRWYISTNAGTNVDPQMILDAEARLGVNAPEPLARIHANETGALGPPASRSKWSSVRYVVQNDGDVGIGTGAPLADLHLMGVGQNITQLLVTPDVAGTGVVLLIYLTG